MSSRLTITIDETILQRARQYARDHGTTLSKVIEQYLRADSPNRL